MTQITIYTTCTIKNNKFNYKLQKVNIQYTTCTIKKINLIINYKKLST